MTLDCDYYVLAVGTGEAELPNLENWSFADLRNPLMSSREGWGDFQ